MGRLGSVDAGSSADLSAKCKTLANAVLLSSLLHGCATKRASIGIRSVTVHTEHLRFRQLKRLYQSQARTNP